MFIQLDKVDHTNITPQWVSCNLDPNEGAYMGHSQCKIDISNAQTYVTTNDTLTLFLCWLDVTNRNFMKIGLLRRFKHISEIYYRVI